MSGQTKTFQYGLDVVLEGGQSLDKPKIGYTTYGDPKSPVVWIAHGITANSDPREWWPEMVGRGKFFDPEKYFIVCSNALGSCYGTSGPEDLAPDGEIWGNTFPTVTIKDMVKFQEILSQHLEIEKIDFLVGASLGGQIALEWSIQDPGRIRNLILLATNARHSAWGIAFNESQRLAIQADPTYFERRKDAGQNGLKAARSVALLSYRGYESYNLKQTESDNEKYTDLKAANYQNYQGEKLVKRFNAHSYVTLSKAMDSHNVGRGRASIEASLARIEARTLIVSISSDILFPVKEQDYLDRHINDSTWEIIDSDFGHDGFLIEHEKLTRIFTNFFIGEPSFKTVYNPKDKLKWKS